MKKILLVPAMLIALFLCGCQDRPNATSSDDVTIPRIDDISITDPATSSSSITIEMLDTDGLYIPSSDAESGSSKPAKPASSSTSSSLQNSASSSSSSKPAQSSSASANDSAVTIDPIDIKVSGNDDNTTNKETPKFGSESSCQHNYVHTSASADGVLHWLCCQKCGETIMEDIVEAESGYVYHYCGKSGNKSTYDRYQEELRELNKKPSLG